MIQKSLTTTVLSRKDSFLPILKENIRAVVGEDITGKVEEIDKEIKHRQAELLRPGNNDKQIEKIGDAITYLRESRQEILTEAALKKRYTGQDREHDELPGQSDLRGHGIFGDDYEEAD